MQFPEEIVKEFWVFTDVSPDEYEACARHVAASLSWLPDDRLAEIRAALVSLLELFSDTGWPPGTLDALEDAANSVWLPPYHVDLRAALETILANLEPTKTNEAS